MSYPYSLLNRRIVSKSYVWINDGKAYTSYMRKLTFRIKN